jgi:hypothetical protein
VTWDDFASAWSEAYDGYDLRQASGMKQTVMRAVHRASGVVRVRTSATMLASVLCSVTVPLLAWKGGQWAIAAASMLLLGQFADAMSSARAVLSGHITRLERFYQALVERFAEVCWLVALLVLGARPTAVVLCAFVVWAHEYLRAKVGGSAMRRAGTSTMGDRSLRVWFVVVALLLSAAVSRIGTDLAAGVVTMVVLCWLALGLIGLAQLFTIIRKVLT